ncbi:hypothetical protein [Alicyclobacillus acidocaldarius]|uniref:Uncharacterized protein n=1 Tax=Alicyclobacillus acidocaldarius (strain Tc-4-1) TaxID=1048834 RepID=F8IGU1_ALIAT|nr:hypothetical protein [Alicyclobacillus acidocaldarius]AEJ43106.1 hypothetical protein TC41_1161 [Alicyclobacillus acidocaldarius subsp. acidocaldarius Tc-4-1]
MERGASTSNVTSAKPTAHRDATSKPKASGDNAKVATSAVGSGHAADNATQTSTSPSSNALLNNTNSVLFVGRDGSSVRIPVVAIQNAQYGIPPTKPLLPYPPGGFPTVYLTIPSDQVPDLCVYFLNDGTNDGGVFFLGPKGWQVTRAGEGVDASVFVQLENFDATNSGTLTYSIDTAAGLVDDDIMAYFPNWQQILTPEDESFGPVTSPTFAGRALLNSHTLAYELADGTNGIAIFAHSPNTNWFFLREELRGLPHALETTILNEALASHA